MKKITAPAPKRGAVNDLTFDLLSILQRRKILIIAALLPGMLVGAAYYVLVRPKYQSRAQILLMPNDSGAMASQIANQTEPSISEDLLATHMSLLQSKRFVSEALRKSGVDELPSLVAELDEDESPTQYVINRLYVTRGGEGAARAARVLSVAVRHTDPDDAQKIAVAVLNEYQDFVKSKFNDVNKEAVELISKARRQLESDISELSSEYRAFRSTAPLMPALEGAGNIYSVRYEELAADLSTLLKSIDESSARLELVKTGLARLEKTGGKSLEKLALIDQLSAERLGVLVTVERGEAQSAAFISMQPERAAGAQTEYSSLLLLKAQLGQALAIVGPKHPDVRTLKIQISEMETFLRERSGSLGVGEQESGFTPDDVMNAYVSLLANDLVALEQQKLDITQQMKEAERAAKELVDFELQDEEFQRRMLMQEDLYNSVVERLRDINLQQDSSQLIQEVIEYPAPGYKVSPTLPIAAALALFTTILLSGCAVVVAELTDKSIRGSEDLEDIYGVNIITHIPEFERDAETKLLLKRIARSNSIESPSLITLHDPKSLISETFRSIRTHLLFQLGGKHKLLAVTSPCQGDGKSTVIANLAVSIANTGKSVLLVDCDMRRPSIHTLFGLMNEVGLSDVVSGSQEFADTVLAGPAKNLSILTSGNKAENPAEILSCEAFRSVLELFRSKYDIVLLDCPPVLPVSDPLIIARHADLMVLVTSLDRGGVPNAKHCKKSLQSANANLCGVIVNRAGASRNGYDYSQTYYRSGYRPVAKANGYA